LRYLRDDEAKCVPFGISGRQISEAARVAGDVAKYDK